MDLDTVADELYGLRPEDFVAARDARAAEARRAGDRALAGEIGKLRRPSLSAWASNLLVRERHEEAESLLRLGEELRRAHRDLDGAQLRDLSRQQHVVINALSRQARRLADQGGHPISDDAQREVETILHAVLSDTEAAEGWATGRLVRAFGEVAGFPAAADGARPRPVKAGREKEKARPAGRGEDKAEGERRRRLEDARHKAEDAERELKAREDEATQLDEQADTARAQVERLERRAGELTDELRQLEEDQQEAETAARKAREQAKTADRHVREARRRAETAAGRVTRLTDQGRKRANRRRGDK